MESIQQRLTCLLRWPLSFQNIIISLTKGWGLRWGEGGESFCDPACTLTGFGVGEALNPRTDSPAPGTVRPPAPWSPPLPPPPLGCLTFLSGLLIASLSFPLLFPHFSLSPPSFSSSFSSISPLSESPSLSGFHISLDFSSLSFIFSSLGFCLLFVCFCLYLPLSVSPSPALITFISVSTELSLSLPRFLSLALKRYFPDFGNHPFPHSGGPMDEMS